MSRLGARRSPCSRCPAVRDTPPGEFTAASFERLAETQCTEYTEGMTWQDMIKTFACHASADGREIACAGVLAMTGHDDIGTKILIALGKLPASVLQAGADWPRLFDSYDQMAEQQGYQDTDMDNPLRLLNHLAAATRISQNTNAYGWAGPLDGAEMDHVLGTLGQFQQIMRVLNGPVGDGLAWTALTHGSTLDDLGARTGWDRVSIANRLDRAYQRQIDQLMPGLHHAPAEVLAQMVDRLQEAAEFDPDTGDHLMRLLSDVEEWETDPESRDLVNVRARAVLLLLVARQPAEQSTWNRATVVVRILNTTLKALNIPERTLP